MRNFYTSEQPARHARPRYLGAAKATVTLSGSRREPKPDFRHTSNEAWSDMTDIFLTRHGRTLGPYSEDQVRAMLREGKVIAQAWLGEPDTRFGVLWEVLAGADIRQDARAGGRPSEATEIP